MHILILNQYFHPDVASTGQLLTELAEDLARYHRVTVVAGRPSYAPSEEQQAAGLVAADRQGDVIVLRTWSTTFARQSMVGRLANYATYLSSCLLGALRAGPPDVVVAMTDPPIVAAVALLTARIRQAPFVYVNQDIFPQVATVLGRLRIPIMRRLLDFLNKALRRRATRLVVIGRDMLERLLEQGALSDKIRVIPNWADGSLIRPIEGPSAFRRKQRWDGRFVVMHSGNVGLSQDLETLLEAADLLRDLDDLTIAIVGDGASKAALRERASRVRLQNVTFFPYQPKSALSDTLGAADLHLVSLKRGLAGYIVPSKVYGIMAAGRPFIAAVERGSEVARIAEEFQCAVRIDPGDPVAMAETIRRMRTQPLDELGRRGRRAFEEYFDRPIATAAYCSLLEDAVRRPT